VGAGPVGDTADTERPLDSAALGAGGRCVPILRGLLELTGPVQRSIPTG